MSCSKSKGKGYCEKKCGKKRIEETKVLSIQSHVVSGYAGNKSATFPLQVLGFEVDPINSVQFSNHTAYKVTKGQVLSDADLMDLMDGLRENKLDFYSHLLTGYIGSASFAKQICNVIKHLKEVNPNLIYVCDPVMGDNGKMYVPEDLLPIYRNNIIPLADILTPNQYEVELLTGIKIETIDDAWKAIDIFHKQGIKTVAISSSELAGKGLNKLMSLASHMVDDKKTRVVITFPKLKATFVGSGDLYTACLLAWMHKTDNDIKISIEKTIGTLQSVLKCTAEYAQKSNNVFPGSFELRTVQCKKDIEEPEVTITAEIIDDTQKKENPNDEEIN